MPYGYLTKAHHHQRSQQVGSHARHVRRHGAPARAARHSGRKVGRAQEALRRSPRCGELRPRVRARSEANRDDHPVPG